MITVTITGIDDVLRKLEALKPDELATPIGVAVAEEARSIIATYPAASRKKQPFRSAKARRFFFAALKRGEIDVPYRRGGRNSQGLGRRWVINPMGNGAELTNTASYSALVQSKQQQAGYHQGNWPTDGDVAERMEQSGSAQQIAEDVVREAISKL